MIGLSARTDALAMTQAPVGENASPQLSTRLHDPKRLQALQRTGLLDSAPEPTFDRITALVCRLLRVPVALISFVDSDRQFFKSSQGLSEPVASARSTPLSYSFCQHVVNRGAPLAVENAQNHALVCDNLAVRELGVMAYLGYPLFTPDGEVIGSLCALDLQPHAWSAEEQQTLADLAAIVIDEIALNVHMRQQRVTEQQRQFQALLLDTVQQAVIATDLHGNILHWNRYAETLYGWSQPEVIGRAILEVTPAPHLVMEAAQIIAKLQQGESWSGEFVVRRRDGSTFPAHVTNSPFYNEQGELAGIVGISRDISERKRSEAALLESSARLRNVIDNLFTFVGLMTPAGILIEANRTALAAAALRPEDVLDKPFAEAYWWSYSSAIQAQLRTAIAAAAAGQASRYDVQIRLGTDRFIIIDFMLAPIINEQGIVTFLVPSGLDITERKAAEVALQESETRFRGTFENAAVGIAHVAIDGSWLHVNQRLCDIVGYTRTELLQSDFQTITHPQDLEKDLGHFHQLLAGQCERYQLEKRYFHKNGQIVWIYLTVALQRDVAGTPLYAISVIEDISERKAVEDRLRYLAEASIVLNSSLDYRVTLQRLAELLTPQWADWCVVDIIMPDSITDSPHNPKLERVAVAHADPAKVGWLHALQQYPNLTLHSDRGASNAMRTGLAQLYVEVDDQLLVQRVKDPQELALLRQLGVKSAIVVPLQVRETIMGALTLIWSDSDCHYTESDLHFIEELASRTALAVDNARLYQDTRAAESALLKLNETLEQRVAERTADLERSNRELDQFAYIASHDLRAPLRAIDNLSAWIAEDAGALLPAKSREHLQKLQERIQRMEALLDDLLAYSRADRLHGQPSAVDSGALVLSVVQLLAPASRFQIIVPATLPYFTTLRVPLETVLRNLIGNAIKHHKPSPAPATISINGVEGETQVTFSVTDDGPGIDPAFHERIFGMFQTLQPRDQVEGSGVGLAIVKKIVESLGGKIQVESAAGQGATFRFTWPKF